MNRLDEIRARLAAATPGPWGVCFDDTQPTVEALAAELGKSLAHGGLKLWGVVVPSPGEATEWKYPAITGNGPTSEANARFIAAAPGDVAYLVSLVERFAGWPSGIRHRIECRVYEGETPLDARCSCGLSDLLREAGP